MDNISVLVVDDEVGIRLAVKSALEHCAMRLPDSPREIGFDVDGAASCEEALKTIENSMPDIFMMDHKLFVMFGLDILNHLAMNDYNLMRVIITASAWPELSVKDVQRGGCNFLLKPFTARDLFAVIYKTAQDMTFNRHTFESYQENARRRIQPTLPANYDFETPLANIEKLLFMLTNRYAGNNLETYDLIIEHYMDQLESMRKNFHDHFGPGRFKSDKTRENGKAKKNGRPFK